MDTGKQKSAVNETNVVTFEPRRRQAPACLFVELRLGADFTVEMSLHDSTGVVGTLVYGLTAKTPPDFDLGRLRASWDVWRDSSTIACDEEPA